MSLGHPPILEDREFPRRFAAMWAALMAVGIENLGATLGRELTADDVEAVNWAQARVRRQSLRHPVRDGVGRRRRSTGGRCTSGGPTAGTSCSRRPLAAPPLPIGALYDADDGIAADNPMAPSIRAGQFVAFTPPYNATGQPAISLPLHWNADGLPIGVQLVAAYGREDLLIAVASQLEVAAPWADRHPAL